MLRTTARLTRGALPAVLVATLIPLALFYIVVDAVSVEWAIALSAAYAYGVAAFQWRRFGRLSGMLLVTVFMSTMRALAAFATGHVVLYFALPVVETAGFGLMFSATLLTSEPLVVRLARDLVPHAAEGIAATRRLTTALSLLWTGTYLASCATSLVLLATVPLPVFLGAHTLTGWFWTGSGMALTVAVCRRRAAGLLAAEPLMPGDTQRDGAPGTPAAELAPRADALRPLALTG